MLSTTETILMRADWGWYAPINTRCIYVERYSNMQKRRWAEANT